MSAAADQIAPAPAMASRSHACAARCLDLGPQRAATGLMVLSHMPSTRDGFSAAAKTSRVELRAMGAPWFRVPVSVVRSELTVTFHVPLTAGTRKLRLLPSAWKSVQGMPPAP